MLRHQVIISFAESWVSKEKLLTIPLIHVGFKNELQIMEHLLFDAVNSVHLTD